ncbi:acetylxylan esterase [Actinotalea caeni]|uniref:acetylxylan esterase n=1 Tax=Actinotalea caeni TaxID=1348467 RepID=UPI0032C20E2A
MPHFDLPLAELEWYHPDVEEPVDFDAFWERTLAEARRHDLALRLRPVDAALARLEVHDVTFAGFGGHPIKAWYVRPARLPVVVSFAGYSAGRGKPWDHTLFPAAGYGVLRVDARGQGWTAPEPGDTGDPVGHGPAQPGFLTRGLEDPDGYYYRRLYTDAARAVDAARALPGADPEKVVVAGTSQGGGTAIAAAALVPDVAGMMADVPFMQHVRHSVELVDTLPYGELAAPSRDAPRRRRADLAHDLLRRRRHLGGARASTVVVVRRAHGHLLPAVQRLRLLQPLPRAQADARVRLQPARRQRRHAPARPAAGVAESPARLSVRPRASSASSR